MQEVEKVDELAKKALVHLYRAAVVGSIGSTSLILGMNVGVTKNPRFADLFKVFELLGPDRRELFYKALTSIAEFAVFRTLDFVEQYNRFDSEANENQFPQVMLIYSDVKGETVENTAISEFGTEKLGNLFKEIARSDEMTSLVNAKIGSAVAANPAR